MRPRVVLGLGSLLVACQSSSKPDVPFELASRWITSDREWLRDDADRVVVLRGVNARAEGIFDVTFSDGRTALEEIPELTAEDIARMGELGFNVLRLPVNWSGIEPERDSFDEAYLDRVQTVVDRCAEAGIYVMIDIHQDAYSKEIGEDGAPLWAIHPAPTELLEGPLGDTLEERRVSAQVLAAFNGFFTDDDEDTTDVELQAEFAEMLTHVAERFADQPFVIGYEIYNEPVAPAPYLVRFYDRVRTEVRTVDDRHLLFFEPNATRNLFDEAPLASAPFGDPLGVYAPHLYTYSFGDFPEELTDLGPDDLRPNLDGALAEARSWQTPLFVGEWGISPQAINADLYVRFLYEHFDDTFTSTAVWLWKEQSQGRWGFYDYDDATATWTERADIVAQHSRIYAQAIAGRPLGQTFDAETGRYELRFEGRDDGVPTRIFVPPTPIYPAAFTVLCEQNEVASELDRDPADGTIEVECGGAGERRIEVAPR